MKADMVRHFDQMPPPVRAALRNAIMNIPVEVVQRAWWRGDLSVPELVKWIRTYDRRLARGEIEDELLAEEELLFLGRKRPRSRLRVVRRFLPRRLAAIIDDRASR